MTVKVFLDATTHPCDICFVERVREGLQKVFKIMFGIKSHCRVRHCLYWKCCLYSNQIETITLETRSEKLFSISSEIHYSSIGLICTNLVNNMNVSMLRIIFVCSRGNCRMIVPSRLQLYPDWLCARPNLLYHLQ